MEEFVTFYTGVFVRIVIAILFAGSLAACSATRSNLPLQPSSPAHLRAAAGADAMPIGVDASPFGGDAFPIGASAFPLGAGATPVGSDAFATCARTGDPEAARCHAEYRRSIPPNGNPATPASQILGYHPGDLQSAYGLTGPAVQSGGDQTVALIVAFHNPDLESDLRVYRATFGLAPCTFASGCLRVLNDDRTTTAPPSTERSRHGTDSAERSDDGSREPTKTAASNPGWAAEEVLDAEMVSAICPNCNIMVVESHDAKLQSLANSVTLAASNGATEISNSYSVPESRDLVRYAANYQVNGIPITAGAGDLGYGVYYPAAFATVTAVGGTSLINTSRGWFEAVWPGTGSGCSEYISKPSWQTDTGCSNRTMNDLAVVADPATGVSAYVSVIGGWAVFGGTSVGAPIVAAMYALAGNGRSINDPSILYAQSASFLPVFPRANGRCTPSYLCHGGTGYTGPAGLGMPTGLTAF
jgi:hypothetical protein